ncbi:MAG: ribosomal protein L13e [Nitrososphaerales archaeon]
MERAIVKKPPKGVNKVREGRGFSLAELRQVGLDGSKAVKKGVPFDKFRKTKHEENVKKLNSIFGQK